MNIKNIIFDLGGILVGIDYQGTINAFKKLGVKDFDKFFTQMKQNHLFDQWDIGQITPAQFRDHLREVSGIALTDQQIDHAWNSMLGEFPAYKVPFLREVSKHYRTFLLSNTNAIHIPFFKDYMLNKHGINGLDGLMEKLYYSHEVNMRKPHVEIFEHVVRDSGLNPSETLFFDDTYMHVEGARKAGLYAGWIDISKEDVTDCFEQGRLREDYMLRLQNQ